MSEIKGPDEGHGTMWTIKLKVLDEWYYLNWYGSADARQIGLEFWTWVEVQEYVTLEIQSGIVQARPSAISGVVIQR